MTARPPLLTACVAALFAASAAAQETPKRAGDADKRDGTGSEVFAGSGASKSRTEKESERGAASRSAISGQGTRQVPRSDTFSGMSGRTGRGGAPLGGGGGRF